MLQVLSMEERLHELFIKKSFRAKEPVRDKQSSASCQFNLTEDPLSSWLCFLNPSKSQHLLTSQSKTEWKIQSFKLWNHVKTWAAPRRPHGRWPHLVHTFCSGSTMFSCSEWGPWSSRTGQPCSPMFTLYQPYDWLHSRTSRSQLGRSVRRQRLNWMASMEKIAPSANRLKQFQAMRLASRPVLYRCNDKRVCHHWRKRRTELSLKSTGTLPNAKRQKEARGRKPKKKQERKPQHAANLCDLPRLYSWNSIAGARFYEEKCSS